MKIIAAFLCLAVAASVAHAETTPAVKPADPKDAPLVVKLADPKDAPLVVKSVDPKAVPAKPADPKATTAAKKEVKKEAPLPKIPGTMISRSNGTFLGLQVVSGNFVLTFYDKKHKPMAVDVTRGTARWPNPRSVLGPNHTVLNPNGTSLVGSKPVLPPFNFSVVIILLNGEGEEAKAVENYTVPVSS